MKIQILANGLIFLSLSLASLPTKASDFLILLRGESSKSALQLHELLLGSEVETYGTIKTIVLDSERGTRLSCDSRVSECSLSNSDFIQTESSDFDQLMRIQGPAARKLFDSISVEGKTSSRIFHHLGTSGRYGTDILDCKMNAEIEECQLIRSYCYFPGC